MISVIVPVYNVENYLKECLDSICKQTYKDLEIILVDDGSTDSSGSVCDSYSERDSRIKVIHQVNGGAASAKNTALRHATGKYLAFVDSDDVLEPDAYQFMISKMEEHQADIIRCSYANLFTDCKEKRELFIKKQEMSADEFLELFTKDWTCGLLWDKLYLRSLFDGIFFEEGHKIDDEFFTYQGVMNAEKIIQYDKCIYNYRMRKSSVMSSESSLEQIVRDKADYSYKRRKNILARYPQLKEIYDAHYVDFLLLLIKDPYVTEMSLIKIKEQIREFLHEKQHCISCSLRVHLYRVLYSSNRKLLLNRRNVTIDSNKKQYFD